MKILSATFDMQSKQIDNVTDPSTAQDAATKNYVDGLFLDVVDINFTDAGTTNAPNVLAIGHDSSGAAAANFGTTMLWQAKSDTTLGRTIGDLSFLWTVPADLTRASKLRLRTVNSGSFVNNATFWPNGGASINRTTDPGAGNLDISGIYMTAGSQIATNDLAASATNDTPAAGKIGQTVNSFIASASAVSYTTNQTKNLTSISLTAGDWDVRGAITFNLASVAASTLFGGIANIGTTTGTITDDGGQSYAAITTTASALAGLMTCALAPRRLSLASTTTVYLVGRAPTFASGTVTAYGFIEARRMR